MEEHLCANCGASLPPTGTFCLACDTPVAEERSALSVAETFVAERGRPLRAVAWVVGVVVVVGGLGYGIYSMNAHHANGQAANAAIHGVQVIVRAEAGHAGACPYARGALSGTRPANRAACKAVIGTDPKAVIHRLHAVKTVRSGNHGTVELRGTWSDTTGRTPFDQTFAIKKLSSGWVLDWDGKPLTATG